MQRTFARAAFVLAACLGGSSLMAAPTAHQQNGIAYINGGVGQEEQTAMKSQRADYNLLLTFANNGSGAFRSDVQVDIMDAKGAALVSVPNAGPMFFARLTPGTYRLTAAAEGKTFKRTVKIGTGAKELTLHWDNDATDDPGPQD
jgi:hypothetical protein